MSLTKAQQLEQYTLTHPQELLIVTLSVGNETEEIMIYKGFSSSLTGKTEYNPDIPLISEEAQIISIDRLTSPYNPLSPHYLQQGLTWTDFISVNPSNP